MKEELIDFGVYLHKHGKYNGSVMDIEKEVKCFLKSIKSEQLVETENISLQKDDESDYVCTSANTVES